MFTRLAFAAVLSTVVLVTRSTQGVRPLYSIHDLGPISLACREALPSLNEVGAVALTTEDGCVLWIDGVARKLDGLDGACDVDANGAVVGWVDEHGGRQAALWKDGVIVRVGPARVAESVARVIDLAGCIAGTYRDERDGTERSFLDDHGRVRDLGGPSFTVEAMNDAGVLVGSTGDEERLTHAVGGMCEHLGDLLLPTRAPDASRALAVNEDGVVVGSASIGARSLGVVFELGRITSLPAFPRTTTCPRAIDCVGRVVGHASAGEEQRAILISGHRIHDLQAALGPEASEWRLFDATDINDAGDVVGYGEHEGRIGGFLLRPLDGVGIAPPPSARTPAMRTSVRPAGGHTATMATAPAQAAAVVPQRPGRTRSVSVAGTWQVRGRDLTDWTATLVLDSDTNVGSFDWLSTEGYSGHELVTWSLDASTGSLHLAGHTMLHPVGPIALGTYDVRLSDDGTQLLEGTWGPGASNLPAALGTWTASR
jgi:hypothetical protein